MTVFVLVRHGAHDRLHRFLDGRRRGVHLNALGLRQADWAATRLAGRRIDAVYTSPLERARETAAAIATSCGLDARVAPELEELDFGEWSGCSLPELEPREDWRRWNAARAIAATPAGDSMRAAQTRMLDLMDVLRRDVPDGCIVLVGHSDPLKTALLFHLGLGLDQCHRIELSPGSLSRIEIGPWSAAVIGLNEAMPE